MELDRPTLPRMTRYFHTSATYEQTKQVENDSVQREHPLKQNSTRYLMKIIALKMCCTLSSSVVTSVLLYAVEAIISDDPTSLYHLGKEVVLLIF